MSARLLTVAMVIAAQSFDSRLPALAQDKPDKVDQAIGRAMKYLVSAQGKDGELADRGANLTAMTSLAYRPENSDVISRSGRSLPSPVTWPP